VRDTFIASLTKLAERDPRVFLITGDLGFAVLDNYSRNHSHQFLNAGVAEQNMTGLATGLALDGRIVFTYSIGNFPTLRALEQIRNDAAYHDANVNVVAVGGGFSYGALGISHHATEDLAILRSLPGLTVVAPGDDWETECAVPALAARPGTTYLRLDRSSAGRTQREGEEFVLGQARRLREGTDATLVSTGGILSVTLAAADELLSKHGIRVRVLSMHTIVPLDVKSLEEAASETGGIVTVEEHSVHGGLGGAVAESLLESGVVPRAFHRIGLRSGFSSIVGSQDYLRAAYGMDAPSIVEAVRRLVEARRSAS
jgi:transketolase